MAEKVAMAWIKISRKMISTNPNRTAGIQGLFTSPFLFQRRQQAGFTLFEILIVVGIIAGILAVLVPKVVKTESSVKKVSRHLLVLSKDVRNQARLKNRTYRIVFRMTGEEHGYWVESSDALEFPKTQEQMEEEARKDEKDRPTSHFQKDEKFSKTEYKLGKNLYFSEIETQTLTRPVSEGLAYIYYSPQGLVEASAIHLTDRKDLNWTLFINALTGHVDIVNKSMKLGDVKLE